MRKHLLNFGTIALALFAAVVWIPSPSDVHAGGGRCGSYGYSNCYTPTYYQQPEYIYVDRVVPVAYPVPFTVAVPVVSYLYNGGYGIPGYSPVYAAQPATAAPAYGVQQPQMQQPTAPANGNGNYGNGNGAPKTSALLQLTDAELDLLIGMIEKRLAARNGNAGSPPTAPKPTSPPPPVPQAPQAPKSYTDADVLRVLSTKLGATQKSCMDCHVGASAKGGVKIFESPGVLNPGANWSKIWDSADGGRMPKEAQTNKAALLSDADCDVLRWKMTQSNGR
jgi:hypothetical protein